MKHKIMVYSIILVILVTVGYIGIATFCNPETKFVGHVYSKAGTSESNWKRTRTCTYTGVEKTYGYEELKQLASEHRCAFLVNQPEFGIGIYLNDAVAVFIYGDQEKLMSLTTEWGVIVTV